MSEIANELDQELMDALEAAGRPLSVGELYAASDLAEGRATVAERLAQLVRSGRIYPQTLDNGGRAYAPCYTRAGGNDRPAAERAASSTTNADLVLQVLRDAGDEGLKNADIAESTGLPGRVVSNVLQHLRQRGDVECQGPANRYARWRIATLPAPAATAASTKPAADAAADSDAWEALAARHLRERLDAPRPQYAVFADGALVISDRGGNTCEFDAADAWGLICFLNAIDHAAVTGKEAPCQ
jgi:hypothetical protein